MTTLAIVIPCFNEEAVLCETAAQVGEVLREMIANKQVSEASFIYFVDDGSRDATWRKIVELNSSSPLFKGHKLAANAGHQKALLSGLLSVKDKADVVISLDADLQDDIKVLPEFVQRYVEGYEVIYGVRKERHVDSVFKRSTALGFYWLMRKMGVRLVHNHADYRLLSRNALNALARFEERNLFLRGIIPLLGFKTTNVYYDRQARFAGESKYPLRKMLAFAFEGITSFSITPLRIITALGFAIFVGSLLLSAWTFVSWLRGNVIPGWTSTVLPIYMVSGIQIASVGMLGEYLGKVYMEVKRRPSFIIESCLG
jgi:polyisoprenyl-phosphate glycosyltransferase